MASRSVNGWVAAKLLRRNAGPGCLQGCIAGETVVDSFVARNSKPKAGGGANLTAFAWGSVLGQTNEIPACVPTRRASARTRDAPACAKAATTRLESASDCPNQYVGKYSILQTNVFSANLIYTYMTPILVHLARTPPQHHSMIHQRQVRTYVSRQAGEQAGQQGKPPSRI